MFRRAVVAATGLLMGASVLAPIVTATSAGATVKDPTGSVEICKVADPASPIPVTGSFNFTVTGVPGTISVAVGNCSAPIAVSSDSGQVTITEQAVTGIAVTAITQVNAAPAYLLSTNLAAQTATVSISPTTVSAVRFQDAVQTGYVEICKQTSKGDNLTGTFGFTVTNAAVHFTSATINVPVGACSSPVLVPVGQDTVTEAGTNLYVTGITATNAGGSNNALVSANTTTGTAVVNVVKSAVGDFSLQTDVTYTNDTVTLKVCKNFTGTVPAGVTTFPFSFTTSGAAGPNTLPASANIAPGNCQIIGGLRAGTQVNVTEGIVPGTKVASIVASGAESVVPGTTSTLNGTISILVGTPTSASPAAPGNEAIITYTDQPAAPGQLKICKVTPAAPTPPLTPSSGVFTFTVAGVATPVLVPVGSCVIVPGTFPYGSQQTITETPVANVMVTAISVSPTFLTQLGGATTTPVVVSTNLGSATKSATPTAASATVRIGEQNTTEVTFTNVDPPITTDAGQVTTVDNPGTNAGTTTAVNPVIATTVASGIATTVASAPTVTATSITATTKAAAKALTPKQRKALLKADEKSLSKVQAQIKALQHTMQHAKGHALKVDKSRLAALKAKQHVLQVQIKLLK